MNDGMLPFRLNPEQRNRLIELETLITECPNGCLKAFRSPNFKACAECEPRFGEFDDIVNAAWESPTDS